MITWKYSCTSNGHPADENWAIEHRIDNPGVYEATKAYIRFLRGLGYPDEVIYDCLEVTMDTLRGDQ